MTEAHRPPPSADPDEPFLGPLADLSELEDRGHRIVESLAGDVKPTDRTQKILDQMREERKDSFHGDVLYYLTSERFPENQAKALWEEILAHKVVMSERMGRNVGIRVSAFDYLVNVRKLIHAPRIIKSSDFLQAVRLARTDSLTGLFTRRYFIEHANKVLEAAGRMKSPVALMMTDLDKFKQFNDQHGHQAGDLLLQEVARLVRKCVRKSDLVVRYGGDEFALFLPKAGHADTAPIAEKIRQQIEENCGTAGVTISIGIAHFPEDGGNRDDLIAAADELLYRAKEFGGNKICGFVPTTFRFASGIQVRRVAVVGDFNNWNKDATVLTQAPGKPDWEATIRLKPGRYRYKYLVDSNFWLTDPDAKEFESDGFGSQCSILVVK
ncbi:MAG: diguanylate cyclase [Elusimicrobiota bacterium]